MKHLDLDHSILITIREGLGLASDDTSFDTELIMHIVAAIARLNQNGVGNLVSVYDDTTTWKDLKDETQVEGNKLFNLVPIFVLMSTKLIFDPPAPSIIDHYVRTADELLWRLKIAYEKPTPEEVIPVE